METPLIQTKPQLNVEESRAKRIERQQSRMRDRGGIFKAAEGRNTNLFNMLCRAMPRKSPRKSRGRSRSRSVSPTKKLQIARTAGKPFPSGGSAKKIRTSPRKRAQSESPTKSKGKQKQGVIVEMEDVEDVAEASKAKRKGNKATARSKRKRKESEAIPEEDEVEEVSEPLKAKPRGRKASAPKKAAAKSPRNTKKAKEKAEASKSLDDDQTHKPKGKRKIADSEDGEQPTEDPPPKPKRARTIKTKATIIQDNLEDHTTPAKKPAPKKKAAPKKQTAASRSRAQVLPDEHDKDEDVPHEDPAPTTKPPAIPESVSKNPTKIKVILGNDDECKPVEVPTKVQPKERIATSKSKSKSKLEDVTTAVEIANVINESFRKRTLEEEVSPEAVRVTKKAKYCEPLADKDNKQTRSKAMSKAEGSKVPEKSSSSNEPQIEVDIASKLKKQTKKQVSDDSDSDTKPILSKTKKTKTESVKTIEPQRTALMAKALPTETNTEATVEKSKDSDTINKPPTKTTSRKRKENTTAIKTKTVSQVKKNVKRGVLSGIPPSVKLRLMKSHNHDDYDSDDPIDFLS